MLGVGAARAAAMLRACVSAAAARAASSGVASGARGGGGAPTAATAGAAAATAASAAAASAAAWSASARAIKEVGSVEAVWRKVGGRADVLACRRGPPPPSLLLSPLSLTLTKLSLTRHGRHSDRQHHQGGHRGQAACGCGCHQGLHDGGVGGVVSEANAGVFCMECVSTSLSMVCVATRGKCGRDIGRRGGPIVKSGCQHTAATRRARLHTPSPVSSGC